MLFDQGKDAKIKMQEQQIKELKITVEQMQERADAVLYCLEEEVAEHGEIGKWTVNSIKQLLAPMNKDRGRRIFREEREVHISCAGLSGWFAQSRMIDAEITRKEMKLMNMLYEYLQGKLPKGVKCFAPKLSKKNAYSVIWFLQECINCLPSKYECCSLCGEIYDSESGGHHSELNGKSYCGSCWEDRAEVTLCWDCGDDIFTEKSWCDEHGEYLCKECKKERDRKKAKKEEDV